MSRKSVTGIFLDNQELKRALSMSQEPKKVNENAGIAQYLLENAFKACKVSCEFEEFPCPEKVSQEIFWITRN